MNEAEIHKFIFENYENVRPTEAWGDTFFYYNPSESLPDEIYFATLKTNDDDYDNMSNLNREGVFRLNIGLSKPTFVSLFGLPQATEGEAVPSSDVDYTSLDTLIPHPVYGRIFWASILNPSEDRFREVVKPLLDDAYGLAVSKFGKKADLKDKRSRD